MPRAAPAELRFALHGAAPDITASREIEGGVLCQWPRRRAAMAKEHQASRAPITQRGRAGCAAQRAALRAEGLRTRHQLVVLPKDQRPRDSEQDASPMRAGNLVCLKNAVDDLIDALVVRQREQGAFVLHAVTLHRVIGPATSPLQSIADAHTARSLEG